MDRNENVQTRTTDKNRNININRSCRYHIRPRALTCYSISHSIKPDYYQPRDCFKWYRRNRFWMAFLEKGA